MGPRRDQNGAAGTRSVTRPASKVVVLFAAWAGVFFAGAAFAAPPKMSIYHFDVNTGYATLIVSADGRAVLIDAGDRGRGINPIVEFLNRARGDRAIQSLDFTIATHYDADLIEVSVWRRSYRVFRWRNGSHIGSGDRYFNNPRQ
jgi:beta-lactamase superfamily II metal-dependent hydrolase